MGRLTLVTIWNFECSHITFSRKTGKLLKNGAKFIDNLDYQDSTIYSTEAFCT